MAAATGNHPIGNSQRKLWPPAKAERGAGRRLVCAYAGGGRPWINLRRIKARAAHRVQPPPSSYTAIVRAYGPLYLRRWRQAARRESKPTCAQRGAFIVELDGAERERPTQMYRCNKCRMRTTIRRVADNVPCNAAKIRALFDVLFQRIERHGPCATLSGEVLGAQRARALRARIRPVRIDEDDFAQAAGRR